jgi:hypothetical protein
MKLLKFDTLYPANYINSKMLNSKVEIEKMTLHEYHNWLIKLRMNFSDFYTYNLSLQGWDAQEIFLDNKPYKQKCEKHYFGYDLYLYKVINRIRNLFTEEKIQFKEKLLKRIIQTEKPDVIFVREHSTIRSKFWEQFGSRALLVCRMDCNLPREWSPLSFDLIYTNIPYYRDFFQSNLIPTNSNSNGFDTRLIEEINMGIKNHDVVYVGGLGDKVFTERTRFFETLLTESQGKFNFKWWGYKMGEFDTTYPELAKAYMGHTGGIEMFNVFAESKIVLNYFETTETKNSYNQRIFEVMGCRTLLLAKESESFFEWGSSLATYRSVDDCIDKIIYFLNNEIERESIALEGQKFILKNYNYKELMGSLSNELNDAYNRKFNI